MMLTSVFSVSSFLYGMLKPSIDRYFEHRALAVVERYLESATSAAFWPAIFILSLISCLTLIEGIRNRAYISHQIQDLMVWLSSLWTLLHTYSVTEDAPATGTMWFSLHVMVTITNLLILIPSCGFWYQVAL